MTFFESAQNTCFYNYKQEGHKRDIARFYTQLIDLKRTKTHKIQIFQTEIKHNESGKLKNLEFFQRE